MLPLYADLLSWLADPEANGILAIAALAVALVSVVFALPSAATSKIRSAAVMARPFLVVAGKAAAAILLVALGVFLGLIMYSSFQDDGAPEPGGTPTVIVTPAPTIVATETVEATSLAPPTPAPYLGDVEIAVDPRPAIAGEGVTFIAEVESNLDSQGDLCFTWEIYPADIFSDDCAGPIWDTTAPLKDGQYTVTVTVKHPDSNLRSSGFEFITVKFPGN